MENETTSTPQSSSKMVPIAITIAVILIILVGAIAFTMNSKNPEEAANPQVPTQTTNDTTDTRPAGDTSQAQYQDGTYEAEGNYTSPGGAESLDVTLTLKDGVVEDANVVSNAFRPTSKQMQASFIGGYKDQVIGKRIDEINLTKVSASSLAPKGFNNAVEEIKAQAQAAS